jgi:hypothetical protein
VDLDGSPPSGFWSNDLPLNDPPLGEPIGGSPPNFGYELMPMGYWIGTLLSYIGSPVVTCMLTSETIVIACWTCTLLMERTSCFSPKVGILIGYWFYTNYSTSGVNSS